MSDYLFQCLFKRTKLRIIGGLFFCLDKMVDTVKTTIANENDDWEVAVDTGEFDKRLEQQEKDRAATQVSFVKHEVLKYRGRNLDPLSFPMLN